jgi:hypothetical protein
MNGVRGLPFSPPVPFPFPVLFIAIFVKHTSFIQWAYLCEATLIPPTYGVKHLSANRRFLPPPSVLKSGLSEMNENYDAFLWIVPTKSNPNGEIFDGTKILWHYPPDISNTLKTYQNIPSFCFPDLEIMKLEKPRSVKNEHFIFTLTTDSGVRIFGICLRTLDGGIGQRYGSNRRPRHCLCFITQNPFFTMFKYALQEVSYLRLCMSLSAISHSLPLCSLCLSLS